MAENRHHRIERCRSSIAQLARGLGDVLGHGAQPIDDKELQNAIKAADALVAQLGTYAKLVRL